MVRISLILQSSKQSEFTQSASQNFKVENLFGSTVNLPTLNKEYTPIAIQRQTVMTIRPTKTAPLDTSAASVSYELPDSGLSTYVSTTSISANTSADPHRGRNIVLGIKNGKSNEMLLKTKVKGPNSVSFNEEEQNDHEMNANMTGTKELERELIKTPFYMRLEDKLKSMERTLLKSERTINRQAAEIQRLKNECDTMRQETEKLKSLNNDVQFQLYAKGDGSDIISTAFRFKQNTPRLTNILDYQAYENRLITNLLVYGYRESVDKIKNYACFPLTNSDEEHVLRLVIQETIDSSILDSISFEQTFDSPSLSILSQLHMISLKERKLLVSNLERRMQALKVDSYCSKSQMLAQYKDIEQKLRKYSIPGETIGSDSVIYYAFKSLEQSRRYRGWAEKQNGKCYLMILGKCR
ncbi:unnamed protein product [Ambrosiozyma monospora]|uniref:Unnamed protein product n=1 Tax=Ambrosiozyma monospora TaxID=43982 RepID=A0A9W7DDE3_AMBMO|nr:unnamed protein product [Ambrosiozyma monospora]